MGENIVGSKRSKMNRKLTFMVVIVFMLIVVLFPFVWMILASFKKNADILNVGKMFSFDPTVKNYASVFVEYNFLKPILNSFFISFVSTITSLQLYKW